MLTLNLVYAFHCKNKRKQGELTQDRLLLRLDLKLEERKNIQNSI